MPQPRRMTPGTTTFGAALPALRQGSLGDMRAGAAEIGEVTLRIPAGGLQQPDQLQTAIMEAAWDQLKNQAGFDPQVAGSASFKLRW